MKVINRELQNWAHIITDEIAADEGKGEYFWPKSKSHEIFEQAYMKFINRNLNYFHLENMIRQTTEGNEFNPAFAKTYRQASAWQKLQCRPRYTCLPHQLNR